MTAKAAADAFGRLAQDGSSGDGADWRDQALCTQTDPEVFFPAQGVTTGLSRRVTRQMCQACPVRPECLAFALAIEPVPAGIWGGMTERERRLLKRQAN
jgi:WhiB family transcriptional regulator, redox-sensing transcriptional regulator